MNLLPYSLPLSVLGTVNTLLRKTSVSSDTVWMAPSFSSSPIASSITGSVSLLPSSSLVASLRGGVLCRGICTPTMSCKTKWFFVTCCQADTWSFSPAAWNTGWFGIVTDCVLRPKPALVRPRPAQRAGSGDWGGARPNNPLSQPPLQVRAVLGSKPALVDGGGFVIVFGGTGEDLFTSPPWRSFPHEMAPFLSPLGFSDPVCHGCCHQHRGLRHLVHSGGLHHGVRLVPDILHPHS